MPAFQINDAEWQALVEEPGDVFLAYCSIRRFMDYETGIAGIRRRISEQMIREVLYVAPTRGRHESGSPTRQRVRSVIDRLITLEAIRPIGPMVYELPLASRDGLLKRSATDEQPHQQPHQQPMDNQPEASKHEAFSEEHDGSATASETGNTGNSNLPPISGDPMMVLPRARQFPMPLEGWNPIAKSFKAIAFKNAVPLSALTTERLNAFCSYWHVRPEKEQTQAQWEYQLVDHLKKQIQFAANSEAKPYGQSRSEEATARRGSGKRSLSAVEQVDAAIAEQRAELAKPGGAAIADPDGEALENDGRDLRPPLDGEFWREAEA